MQTSYFKYFDDVVRLGSITAAAAENHMSPQGISRALSVLEAELGCKLFERRANKLVPSAYAAKVAPLAHRVVAVEQEMFDEVAKVRATAIGSSDRGIVVFVNNVAFDSAFAKPLFASFDELFARTRFFQCDNDEVLNNLLAGEHRDDEIALGLFCFFSPLEEKNEATVATLRRHGFIYRPYLKSYDCALVSTSSDLAGKRALTRADMTNGPLIASNNDIRAVLERLYGSEPIRIVTADSAFRFELVKHGQGISVVPAFYDGFADEGDFDFRGLKKIPLKNPYYLEIGFALPASVQNNRYIEQFFVQLNAFYLRHESTSEYTLLANELTKVGDSGREGVAIDPIELRRAEDAYEISPRERDVFELMVQGKSTSEISEALYISRATTKSHMSSIYKKLGVHSRKELMGSLASFSGGLGEGSSAQMLS